jgi:hypothetical protein
VKQRIAIKTTCPLHIPTNNGFVTVDNVEFIVDTVNGDTIGKTEEHYSYISKIINGQDYFILMNNHL